VFSVTRFAGGRFAEYTCAPEAKLARKPGGWPTPNSPLTIKRQFVTNTSMREFNKSKIYVRLGEMTALTVSFASDCFSRPYGFLRSPLGSYRKQTRVEQSGWLL
jgi:hypothetical protein